VNRANPHTAECLARRRHTVELAESEYAGSTEMGYGLFDKADAWPAQWVSMVMSFSSNNTDSPGDITSAATKTSSPIAVPSICILSLSAIADDPRVRRQGEAFHRAGWKVVAVGVPGAKSSPPDWPIHTGGELPARIPRPVVVRLARRSLRALQYRLRLGAIWSPPEFAQIVYWSGSQRVLDIYDIARRMSATVWLANDWTTLPLAARLARENGGVYGYDTHEFAVEEYAERLKWRLLQRPIVRAIERHFIRNAAVVSAVSSGIAERLDNLYKLPRRTLTIRNTPPFEETPFRPTPRDRIQVLYHGAVVPNRGLEEAVDSVALWRSEFVLTIRGPENPNFTPKLRERIAALGLENRVHLASAVPMTALVREAALFDVGLFALPGHSQHNELALPNKFFEYVMAGLAICTTDLPEMSNLIRQYELGVTIVAAAPKAIASAINTLEPDRIDQFKRNALKAAHELCWERESERLARTYGAVLEPKRQLRP
jgi:glycosyltransferase involved in cell wall biosynthesis